MNFSITKHGVYLDRSLYTWDEKTKTLSTNESGLVLDFSDISYVKFRTGSNCTFNTAHRCTFDTGNRCTFNTGSNCTFKTGPLCIFKTGSSCVFNTGSNCTFDTIYNCTFKTGKECVIVRRDIHEIIEIPENVGIKLNGYGIRGHTVSERETIEIGDQKYYKDEVEEKLKELEPVR